MLFGEDLYRRQKKKLFASCKYATVNSLASRSYPSTSGINNSLENSLGLVQNKCAVSIQGIVVLFLMLPKHSYHVLSRGTCTSQSRHAQSQTTTTQSIRRFGSPSSQSKTIAEIGPQRGYIRASSSEDQRSCQTCARCPVYQRSCGCEQPARCRFRYYQPGNPKPRAKKARSRKTRLKE